MLDKLDKQILNILQSNSKRTIKDIAQELNLSTTPIFERIKRMEAQGIISQYVALVDPQKLDKKLRIFVEISVADHSMKSIDKFVSQIIKHPEIIECHHVTGDSDFLLIIVTKDIEAYNDFISNKLSRVSNVGKVRSAFSLSIKKKTTALHIT